MVMTIRNTCRMFVNLFQLVGDREIKASVSLHQCGWIGTSQRGVH